MTYLVDANVLSEAVKPTPAAQVLEWLTANESDFVVDAVILGGTELPLVLRGKEAAGVPLVDTTQVHARAAVDRLWP